MDDIKLWKRAVLEEYLREFFVEPLPKEKAEALQAIISKKSNFYALKADSMLEIKQISAYFLLSFGHRVFWNAYNSYQFVDLFLNSESLIDVTSQFPVLIIYHGISEMANKRLKDMVNQVVEFRKMDPRFTTLFISTKLDSGKEDTRFCFDIQPLKEQKGSYKL